jgi:hypothetical protein
VKIPEWQFWVDRKGIWLLISLTTHKMIGCEIAISFHGHTVEANGQYLRCISPKLCAIEYSSQKMKQKEANLASEAFIKALKKAIFDPEGSKAAWVKSLLVKEISEGETAREGLVQVFDPIDHPKTNIRHAWSYGLDNSKKRRFLQDHNKDLSIRPKQSLGQ